LFFGRAGGDHCEISDSAGIATEADAAWLGISAKQALQQQGRRIPAAIEHGYDVHVTRIAQVTRCDGIKTCL
jgi:hypothetical protein